MKILKTELKVTAEQCGIKRVFTILNDLSHQEAIAIDDATGLSGQGPTQESALLACFSHLRYQCVIGPISGHQDNATAAR